MIKETEEKIAKILNTMRTANEEKKKEEDCDNKAGTEQGNGKLASVAPRILIKILYGATIDLL